MRIYMCVCVCVYYVFQAKDNIYVWNSLVDVIF